MTVAQLCHLTCCGVPGTRCFRDARDRDQGTDSCRVIPKNAVGTQRAARNWP
jgi:hypothetical protein